MDKLSGQIKSRGGISGKLQITGYIHDRLPDYEGDYSVTPKISAITLETANKSMTADLEVEAIPYAEVSNIGGGLTATIGFE